MAIYRKVYHKNMSLIQAFRTRVNIFTDNGCWEWNGGLTKGYGAIWRGGKEHKAHRFSYEKFIGEIPKGLLVCHKCDNRKCCNPNHLFLGTYKDNAQDASKKGRLKDTIHPSLQCYEKYKCRCPECKALKSAKNHKRTIKSRLNHD